MSQACEWNGFAPTTAPPPVGHASWCTRTPGRRRWTRFTWGLIPYWCKDPTGGRKPAKCETVRDLPTFREAYRGCRCIVPVDGLFEWKAIRGQKAKQPYAIATRDGSPFGIAGIWENWKPAAGEWIRTFAIITTDAIAPLAAEDSTE